MKRLTFGTAGWPGKAERFRKLPSLTLTSPSDRGSACRRTYTESWDHHGITEPWYDRGAVFCWAVREGLAPHNTCKGVDRPITAQSLDFLSGEEGSTPKSGKPRHLRLPMALLPILREWRERCPPTTQGLVMPHSKQEDKTTGRRAMLGLPRLMAEIGLRPVPHPWHQLRHTFASHFVMNGGNILALQKILGHSDLKMTLVYAHLAPDFLDGEMDKVVFRRMVN